MIFISYRIHDSNDVVDRLDADLARAFGRGAVFRDKKRLEGGDAWPSVIELNAAGCSAMLVVVGLNWQTSRYDDRDRLGMLRLSDPNDWVRREVSLAPDHGRVVVPVLVNGADPPTRTWLESFGLGALADRQGLRLRTDDYENDLSLIVQHLRTKCPELTEHRELAPELAATTPVQPGNQGSKIWRPAVLYPLQPAPHFAGREKHLSDLARWSVAGDDPDRVMAIIAVGGTGKTALAERVIAGLPDELSFGVLVWSFFENQHTEEFLRAACEYFLDEAPRETGGLIECLQNGLRKSGKSHLFVLDGLELVQASGTMGRPRGELEDPLMKRFLRWIAAGKGIKCKVLLTSRFPLRDLEDWEGHGFHSLDLKDLDLPSARLLLRKRGVKADDTALNALADSVHRHALTVDVLGLYLNRFGNGDPRNAPKFNLQAVQTNQKGERLIMVLESYAAQLPEDERDLLARLSLFPGGVTLEYLGFLAGAGRDVAGALVGCAQVRLLDMLEGLRSLGLVFLSESRDGRTYSAHPFLRDFFSTLLGVTKKEQVYEAVRRNVAPSLNERPGKLPTEPHDLDRYERLIEITRLAGDTKSAFDLYRYGLGGFANLGWALGNFALGRRVLTSLAGGLSPVDGAIDLSAKDRSLLLMQYGQFSGMLGDLEAARQAFRLLIHAKQRSGSSLRALAKVWWTLADIELSAGHWPTALEAANAALSHSEGADSSLDREYSRAYLASAYCGMGMISEARSHFAAANELARRGLYAHRGIREAEFKLLLGERSAAREQTMRNLATCKKERWTHNEARCHSVLGQCDLPDDTDSRKHLAFAREYVDRSGNLDVALRCFLLGSGIARCEGDVPRAVFEAESGIQLADSCGFGRWSLEIRLDLAKSLLTGGDWAAAVEPAAWVLERSQAADCRYAWGIADSLHLLGIARARMGDACKAREALSQVVELRRRLSHPELLETEAELSRLS